MIVCYKVECVTFSLPPSLPPSLPVLHVLIFDFQVRDGRLQVGAPVDEVVA
jgi:hypothetical protein